MNELEDKLFNDDWAGQDSYKVEVLIEQYRLYIEMMDKISERRSQANTFFLTLNTALLTGITGILSFNNSANLQYSWIIFSLLGGIVFCFAWWRLVQSYSQLNAGKFRIIHLLESRLPARLFDAEWQALNEGDGTLYRPFTQVEQSVPIIFVGIHIFIILALLASIF